MDKRVKTSIKILLSVIVAALLLWLSFKEIQWEIFVDGLAQCQWHFVIMAILFGAAAMWLRGLRWRELLLPIDSSTSRLTTFNAVCISYVVNMLVPRGGELLRGGIIARHSKRDEYGERLAGYDKSLGTVLVERLWDTIVLIIIALVFILLSRNSLGNYLGDKLSSINVPPLQGLLSLVLLAAFAFFFCRYFWRRSAIIGKIWRFFGGLFAGIRDSLKMEHHWRFLLYTIAIWLCYWGTSYVVILSLSAANPSFAAMGLMDALFLMIVGSIASVVPVPGGFGAYHYLTSTALLALYGIPIEEGLVFAVLCHESQTIMHLLCGGACYLSETIRN